MIKQYEPSDYEEIMSWMLRRNKEKIHPNMLSEHGFVDVGNAAIWLYGTDSDFCYLENLIANPDSTDRDGAIKRILEVAMDTGKKLGYKFCLSVTDIGAVIARAVAMGGKTEPNKTLITLQLK